MSEEIRATGLAMPGAAPVVRMPGAQVQAERSRLPEEQLAYASVLDTGMKIGLLLIVVTFAIYMTGVLAPHVPVEELPRYWSMPVKTYLEATGTHGGWSWIHMLGKGDVVNMIGIAFLSGVAIICYAAITPILVRRRDKIYAALCVLEMAVLVLAASGVLKSGGH